MPEEKRPKAVDFVLVKGVGKWLCAANTAMYKVSKGKLGGKMGDAAVCLLTTTGRKSGKPRTVPLLHVMDGDAVVLIASKAGYPKHPLWYLNLVANPEVAVQIGGETSSYIARTAEGDERQRLWDLMVASYADYEQYRKWTDREIPVVVCDKAK